MDLKQRALFSHEEMQEGILRISAPLGEQMYVVPGGERAALIDTGMGIGSLEGYLAQLTELPIVVINTHGHPDHAGGNIEFEECRMHPADLPWYKAMCTQAYRARDIDLVCPGQGERLKEKLLPQGPPPAPLAGEGFLDLGGRALHILHTPGHTPGSICLWDDRSGALFAGDSLSSAAVWLYDDYSEPLEVYYQSLMGLQAMLGDISLCCTGHAPGLLPPDIIKDTLACSRRILMYDGEGNPAVTFAGRGLLFHCGSSAILYNPNRLFQM